jgi:hypothetical protein
MTNAIALWVIPGRIGKEGLICYNKASSRNWPGGIEDGIQNLSLDQVLAALRCYADYPDEIDQILSYSETELSQARLYRTLGPEGYRQLTGSAEEPRMIREARASYQGDETPDEPDYR